MAAADFQGRTIYVTKTDIVRLGLVPFSLSTGGDDARRMRATNLLESKCGEESAGTKDTEIGHEKDSAQASRRDLQNP